MSSQFPAARIAELRARLKSNSGAGPAWGLSQELPAALDEIERLRGMLDQALTEINLKEREHPSPLANEIYVYLESCR